MTGTERLTMESLTSLWKRLDIQDKRDLMIYGEGMANKAERMNSTMDSAPGQART